MLLRRSLKRWKENWVKQQTTRSTLPNEYWDKVADEVVKNRRRAFQSGELASQNPHTPMGWYALLPGGDAAWTEVSRVNGDATKLEKAKKIEDAVFWYEVAVADGFPGSHPYDRLRIIYTRQKHYVEASRVCEDYLGLPDRKSGLDKPHFQHHLEKLQAKAQR